MPHRRSGLSVAVVAIATAVLAAVVPAGAYATTAPKVTSGDFQVDVFAGGSSGSFSKPSTPPVFSQQGFSNMVFDPPNDPPSTFDSTANTGICSSGGTVSYDANRPMVFVDPVTCATTVLQNGSGTLQAGAGGLSAFAAEFTGNVTVDKAGTVTFNTFCDDGCVVGIGRGTHPHSPTSPSAVPSHTAKKGYPILFESNVLQNDAQRDFSVTFPASGKYPIELDYAENGSGGLAMTLLANGTPMATGK